MQRFQFRLETLLKIRKMHQEQAQIRLAQATDQFRLEQEKLIAMENKLVETISIFRSRQQGERLMIEIIKSFQYYFDKIKVDITTQKERVRAADQYCQECLALLEEAVKSCKLVEKLREKRLTQYQLEGLKEEQKILDEIGTQRYAQGK